MTRTSLSPVLRQIRRLAGPDPADDASDADLLGRFRTDRDERAFAALLRRHGPLVWGVCWQVLRHRQDAEDAFQATFLLLARHAGSIRDGQAVASWLYRAAYRVATKAGQTMAKRRVLERKAEHRQAGRPEAEAAWRELQAVLQEELERLPERYRTPFLLCCLEGHSGAEAARLLGWKEGTVTGRLSEARKLLQRRLARRGVLLSAVLAAAAVSRAGATTASITLAEGTVRAALAFSAPTTTAGVVSARAAALAGGVARELLAAKLKLATVLLLAAGLVASARVVAHQAQADRAAPPSATAEPDARGERPAAGPSAGRAPSPDRKHQEADQGVVFHGRVLDPAGRPVAGAKLYLFYRPSQRWAYVERPMPAPVHVTAGTDGRFQVAAPKVRFIQKHTAVLVATAAGFGPAWVDLGASDSGKDVSLRLVRDDVPITGRVVDLQARPVSGVTIRVLELRASPQEDLGPWLAAAKRKAGKDTELEARYLPRQLVYAQVPGLGQSVTTDAAGRFRLTGLGRERLVKVRLDRPTIASQEARILTRPGQPLQLPAADWTPEHGGPLTATPASRWPARRSRATSWPTTR